MIELDKVQELIKQAKEKGRTHLAPSFFGTTKLSFFSPNNNIYTGPNNFYIMLLEYSDEWESPHDDEPIHKTKIKVNVLDYCFEETKEGDISCLLDLEPAQELPDWYKDDNEEDFNFKYYEDFNNVPLEHLYTDGF